MNDLGSIIVVGQDTAWINSICDFVNAQGFQCHCAHDLSDARTQMRTNEYDLTIVEVDETVEPQLEFIRQIACKENNENVLPIIVIAQSPSADFMIDVLNLPVTACLIKPIDYEQFKKQISDAIRLRRTFNATRLIRRQLHEWDKQMETIESACKENSRYATFLPVSDFMDISFCNILKIIKDIRALARSLFNPNINPEACHMMNCPRLSILNNALHETVEVLESTKNAFKSRELGFIRKKLENIMNEKTEIKNLNKVTSQNTDTKTSDRLK